MKQRNSQGLNKWNNETYAKFVLHVDRTLSQKTSKYYTIKCYVMTGLFHTKQANTTQLRVTLWQDCHTKQANTTQFSVMWWQDCHTKQVNTTQLSVMWWQDSFTPNK